MKKREREQERYTHIHTSHTESITNWVPSLCSYGGLRFLRNTLSFRKGKGPSPDVTRGSVL